ncbi:uncharacterized protein LOC111586926 [Amphiprion ocellaris]|uniref:uncharacterized protein LOC111586926 n=1 Tax=Amphiprion ocellaris TaxID=80972 RepID=UPI0024114939|nr:uncharacterized protein LOC111586926 [Amphiprion ocellaris]
MAASERKTRISFSPVRRSKQAANDRKSCIMWIKRLVNKQVEKRVAEVCSEFLLMNRVLREEMEAELQELTRLVVEQARERPLHYAKLYQDYGMLSRRPRRMEEEYDESTDEDEDVGKCKQDGRLKSLVVPSSSSDSSDCFTSDTVISDVSSDANSKKIHSFSSAVTPVSDNSYFTKDSIVEGSTRNLFYINPSLTNEDDERLCGDRTTDEEALETMEGTHGQALNGRNNVEPAEKEETEEQGETTPPVSEKKEKQTMKAVKKMKTSVSDFFNRLNFSRWERLEDED